jgi:hypothetical protein
LKDIVASFLEKNEENEIFSPDIHRMLSLNPKSVFEIQFKPVALVYEENNDSHGWFISFASYPAGNKIK